MTWPVPEVPPGGWTTPAAPYKTEDMVELVKKLYQAQLDARVAAEKVPADATAAADKVAADAAAAALLVITTKTAKEDDEDWLSEKADWDAEIALYKSVHDARLEIAKGSLARGQAGAEFVRNAAAGIVTIYTGLLGFVFGVADRAKELPGSAAIPGVFLGFSLAAASFYVAFLTRSPSVSPPVPSSSLRVLAERRVNVFVDWVSRIALARVFWLHAAVMALSFGVIFLPTIFTTFSEATLWTFFWIAVVLNLVIPIYTAAAASVSASPTEGTS
jgi:hypothetical protein